MTSGMEPGSQEERAHFEELDRLWLQAWPAGFPRELRYPLGERPLPDYLREWARRKPDHPALVFHGRAFTYAEYDDLTDRIATLLHGLGVRKGHRVATFLPNCPQFNLVFYGILKLGAIYTPISPMSKAFELTHQLRDSGARVVVAQDGLMPLVREARDAGLLDAAICTSLADVLPERPAVHLHASIPTGRTRCEDAIDLFPALATIGRDYPDPQARLEDVAVLNYTGGTTGLPKGCMHTHRNMLYCAAATASLVPAGAAVETPVNFLPQFWIAGENGTLIRPVFGGLTLVNLVRWDPVALMQSIERYKGTSTVLPVDCAEELIAHPDLGKYDLSSLRTVRVIGLVKKLTADLRRRFEAALGVTPYEASWGMTESHTSNTFTVGMQEGDFDLSTRPTFVGLPVYGTRFKVADFDTERTLPVGEEGELCCLTPSCTLGYWEKPEATAKLIRNGWLHTGDRGMILPSGHILYLGRRKEMIKVKGMSVFPAEIESVLCEHPSVQRAAVVPRADAERGQVPVAFVLLGGQASTDALVRWCAERMASYKVPEVRVLDAWPMTGTGKVKKHVLEEMVATP